MEEFLKLHIRIVIILKNTKSLNKVPGRSVPALLSQTFSPGTKGLGLGQKGISTPGVLSHFSVPGQKGVYLCFHTRSLMDID